MPSQDRLPVCLQFSSEWDCMSHPRNPLQMNSVAIEHTASYASWQAWTGPCCCTCCGLSSAAAELANGLHGEG
ncbi:hypothetical protein FQA47_016265 [Oryzias melastigma]|uniref:Uncharacterized protein n=1 Tax=Oryzias melastigma TaxID=30732 RepID=A0A834F7N2_ORYME|nr:hypothetical protein FQA47_016265 [Oryzias melastigma]